MAKTKSPHKLSKFIAYILERRPDEFGLITDTEGWVKTKELLKAINEESGWKYVRRTHIDEILYSLPDPPIEILDEHIRAKRRDLLPQPQKMLDPPKLLFICIRKRAYPFVLENGIFPTRYPQVVLTSDRDLAERIGKRIDPQPVMLTVHVQKSAENGIMFYQIGESLFTTESIPTGCFSGPPLPKEKPDTKKPEPVTTAEQPKTAGTFLVDLNQGVGRRPTAGGSQKKKMAWKERKKRGRKRKLKRERPPWRR